MKNITTETSNLTRGFKSDTSNAMIVYYHHALKSMTIITTQAGAAVLPYGNFNCLKNPIEPNECRKNVHQDQPLTVA